MQTERGIQKIADACKSWGKPEPFYNVRSNEVMIEFSTEPQFGDEFPNLQKSTGYSSASIARIVISNWMSTYYTLEYLAIWEEVNNPDFNRMGYQSVKSAEGRLITSPKRWIEATNAIGIISKSGRYGGGVFAHREIAFEFATWFFAKFKFCLVKEFDRLKSDEAHQAIVVGVGL